MPNLEPHPFRGFLSEEEWQEVVALDYILTWRFTNNYERDLARYKELGEKQSGTKA